ncbi:MAG: mucin desulfatase, partial [Gemmatimonadota bacterium]
MGPADFLTQFDVPGAVASIAPAAEGHINRSWVVTLREGAAPAGRGRPPSSQRFLLQRINERVFTDPVRVMENVALVTQHLAEVLYRIDAPDAERRALRLVPTRSGAPYHRDADGGVWRLYPFIGGAVVREHVTSREEAREIGKAFGTFQRYVADYAGPRLHETIPRFHDTAWRVETLERALAADRAGRAKEARSEIAALRARAGLAEILPPL